MGDTDKLARNLIQNSKNTIEMVPAKSVHFFMNIIAQRGITFNIVCAFLRMYTFSKIVNFYQYSQYSCNSHTINFNYTKTLRENQYHTMIDFLYTG